METTITVKILDKSFFCRVIPDEEEKSILLLASPQVSVCGSKVLSTVPKMYIPTKKRFMSIVFGWEGLSFKGEILPYTEENKTWFFEHHFGIASVILAQFDLAKKEIQNAELFPLLELLDLIQSKKKLTTGTIFNFRTCEECTEKYLIPERGIYPPCHECPVPRQPKLSLRMQMLFGIWQKLSASDRPTGFSIGRIPTSSILSVLELYGLKSVENFEIIEKIESIMYPHLIEKSEKDQKTKKEPNR